MKEINFEKTVKFFQEQGLSEKEAREAAAWCLKQLKKIKEKTQSEFKSISKNKAE